MKKVPEIISSNAIKIIIFIVVLIVSFFSLRWIYREFTKPEEEKIPDDTQGGGGGSGSGGSSNTGVSDSQITIIVDAIYKDIYSWGTRNAKPYSDLLALSNSDFVRAYNDWNNRYFKEDGETLRMAINNENSIYQPFILVRDTLNSKFSSLGLV